MKKMEMPSNVKTAVCKTIHQYNKEPIPEADMQKLQEIEADYRRVKNYVYERFGGIGSLSKLYPGYTVQNEMTASGLRGQLGMPSVYFYLAVFDALEDIKCQWARTKAKVRALMDKNENFTEEEKHYLRFLLKVNNAFDAVLNGSRMELPEEIQRQYVELAGQVNAEKIHRYLCRQVRRYHVRQHTDKAEGFRIAERAYRYADRGIYISTKENRKRIYIPLTDNNQYKSQIYIKLYPEQGNVEINVPVNVTVRHHVDFTNQIGCSLGMSTMLTTDAGHKYGELLGQYQTEYAEWIRRQTGSYSRNRVNNPGRKKYNARKRRYTEQLHSYINHELNRFLQIEKPKVIYMPKLPRPQAGGRNKKINNAVTLWQRGYVRNRLIYKCREQSVEIVDVLGKDISNECSRCGAIGSRKKSIFFCTACGYSVEEKENSAKNALKRGRQGK